MPKSKPMGPTLANFALAGETLLKTWLTDNIVQPVDDFLENAIVSVTPVDFFYGRTIGWGKEFFKYRNVNELALSLNNLLII